MYNFTVFRLDQCKKYIFVPNYAQDSHVNGSFHRRTSRDGFYGGIEGGGAPPNNWAIVLNMTPQNLVVGGQDVGREAPKLGAEVTVLENLSDFFRKIFA